MILTSSKAKALALSLLGSTVLIGAAFNLASFKSPRSDVVDAPIYLETCVDFVIDTPKASYRAQAEIALSPDEQRSGMMFRSDLAEDAAMLFDMASRANVSFWMKNTPSALDIAFFDERGMLDTLVRAAEPWSMAPFGPSPETKVSFVLEVPAGQAAHLGLVEGGAQINVDVEHLYRCTRERPTP